MTNVDASYDCFFRFGVPPVYFQPVKDPTSDFLNVHRQKERQPRLRQHPLRLHLQVAAILGHRFHEVKEPEV